MLSQFLVVLGTVMGKTCIVMQDLRTTAGFGFPHDGYSISRALGQIDAVRVALGGIVLGTEKAALERVCSETQISPTIWKYQGSTAAEPRVEGLPSCLAHFFATSSMAPSMLEWYLARWQVSGGLEGGSCTSARC